MARTILTAAQQPSSGTGEVKLSADAIPVIRRALLAGFHAIAEVERIGHHFDLLKQGIPIGPDARPISSMGCEGDLTDYAEALLWLEQLQPVDVAQS